MLERLLVDGTVAVGRLGVGVVVLAADAVHALVRVELDVAVVPDLAQERLHGGVVPRLARTDEVVRGDVELGPRLAEAFAGAVSHLPRRQSLPFGRPLDL